MRIRTNITEGRQEKSRLFGRNAEKTGTGQEVSQKHDSPESDGSSGKCRAYDVPPFANCCSACLFFDTEDC